MLDLISTLDDVATPIHPLEKLYGLTKTVHIPTRPTFTNYNIKQCSDDYACLFP